MRVRDVRPYALPLAMLALVPVSVVLEFVASGVAVFVASGLAILPLAYFMGLATEEVSKHAGPGIGGLLNATFGNATELIIGVFALFAGLHVVVKASLTGSILGNLLLILGLSALAGGARHKTQTFSRSAAGTQVSMLLLAVAGLVMPTLIFYAYQTASPTVLGGMSLVLASLLILAYALGLVFSLHTHRDIFNPVGGATDRPRWSVRTSLAVLTGSTLLVALESELLVGSVEPAAAALGLNDLFIGVVIIALVGNAAEHGTAVLMAWKNRMELSVGIATSSTTQVALFVAPVLVLVSLLTGRLLTLNFEILELVSIGLAVAAVGHIAVDGESNWYEGVLLVMIYVAVAAGFYFHP